MNPFQENQPVRRETARRVPRSHCRLRNNFAMTVVVLLLTACGTTTPTNYYLLSARLGSPTNSESPSLGIGPIEIPEYLNRNGLVYNRDGNQLQIANYERWAEPLSSGVERVLGLNLSNLLETQNVQAFPWQRSERPDYAVQVTVLLLDANDKQATLVAEWVLQKPGEKGFLRRRQTQLHYDMPAGESIPEKIAPAFSDLLFQLSQEVATNIRADLAKGSL